MWLYYNVSMKIKYVTNRQKVTGFKYFWMKYVNGFDASVHCARCLLGHYSQKVGLQMPVNTEITIDEFDDYKCIYLCGVIGYVNNLHVAFVSSDNEEDIITAETYLGDKVIITGAKRLPIPPLPNGYNGLPLAYTSCRNYQFGVSFFEPEQSQTDLFSLS